MAAEDMLLVRLKLREEQAFDELVTQQHGLLIRMAMRYVASRDVAEEVVQETWMTVFTSIDRFEGRSSLRAWLCGILIYKAKDRGVREKRYVPFSGFAFDGDNDGDVIDPSRFQRHGDFHGRWSFSRTLSNDRTPEKLLLSKQAVDCMQRAIDALPINLKEVLILRDADGMKTNEVCKRMKVTETNLYVRLHRARARVKRAIEATLG
ncbi:MAG: RNA polymerase sigma factor [Nitrospira sp.]|nr:RNA polymerase sigma factor [Nitrospira sp.]